MSNRERKHLTALGYLVKEDQEGYDMACEDILFEHPNDAFALEMLYLSGILRGNSKGLRNCSARILDSYGKHDRYVYYMVCHY